MTQRTAPWAPVRSHGATVGPSAMAGDPPLREPEGRSAPAPACTARAADVGPCQVDALLWTVAARLRRSGVDLPDARLRQLSEELVVDVARIVLAWAEEPLPDGSRRPPVWPRSGHRER